MDKEAMLKRHSVGVPEAIRSLVNTPVLVMGLKNVGKSTVMQQLQNLSSATYYDRTRKSVGSLDVKGKLQFSEATHFPFKGLRKMAIRASESFVLIYAIDDEESFNYVTKLLSEIINIKGENVPLVVVGNKIDKSPREVHPIIADCVVTIDYECKHKEVCGATGEGIKEVLSCLLGFFGEETAMLDDSIHKSSLKKRFSSFFRKQ